jgi:hypothetical protein
VLSVFVTFLILNFTSAAPSYRGEPQWPNESSQADFDAYDNDLQDLYFQPQSSEPVILDSEPSKINQQINSGSFGFIPLSPEVPPHQLTYQNQEQEFFRPLPYENLNEKYQVPLQQFNHQFSGPQPYQQVFLPFNPDIENPFNPRPIQFQPNGPQFQGQAPIQFISPNFIDQSAGLNPFAGQIQSASHYEMPYLSKPEPTLLIILIDVNKPSNDVEETDSGIQVEVKVTLE